MTCLRIGAIHYNLSPISARKLMTCLRIGAIHYSMDNICRQQVFPILKTALFSLQFSAFQTVNYTHFPQNFP